MSPADWQLPRGVTRGLWDYLNDPELAQAYDARLTGTPLVDWDIRYTEEFLNPIGRLIDLGCGTGRLLQAFAQKGYEVVGVDLSTEMLRVAAAKGRESHLRFSLVRGNLVQLPFAHSTFDHAACLFSTLGMVMGAALRLQVIKEIARILRPGGRFVLHVHNRWWNFWDPQGRRWLIRNWFDATRGKGELGDRVMPVHQGVAGLTLHVFTRREVVTLIETAGLRIVDLRSLSLAPHGRLKAPWWFGALRTYGYLLTAERPLR